MKEKKIKKKENPINITFQNINENILELNHDKYIIILESNHEKSNTRLNFKMIRDEGYEVYVLNLNNYNSDDFASLDSMLFQSQNGQLK